MIVIVVDKLTISRVLRSEVGLCRSPRDGDEVRKFFLSCGDGVRQNQVGRGRRPHPLDLAHLIAIPIS